ncbi:MAG: hypothetical protein KIT27_12240, partial [Legionellales bacterium]|nr:hypothetical protein [Legionellales bacterium]
MRFLVDVRWSGGQVYKEYTMLLDPRGYQRPRVPPKRFHYPAPQQKQTNYVTQKTYERTPEVLPNPANTTAAQTYGPTTADDTLIGIAKKIRPNESVSIEQTLLALYRANPQAFWGNNINKLKADVRLVIPTLTQIQAIPHEQAVSEVSMEDKAWEQEHQDALPMPPSNSESQKLTTDNLQQALQKPNLANESSKLSQPSENSANTQQLEEELTVVDQQLQQQKTENQQLKNQVNELEQDAVKLEHELSEETAKLTQENSAASTKIDTSMDNFGQEFNLDFPPQGFFANTMNIVMLIGLGFVVMVFLTLIALYSLQRRRFMQTLAAKSPLKSAPRIIDVNHEDDAAETLHTEDEKIEPVVDTLEQADLYLNYQRYDQAESILQSAIEREPDNIAYRVKLIQVLGLAHGLQAVQDYYEQLPEKIRSDKLIRQAFAQFNPAQREESPEILASPFSEEEPNTVSPPITETIDNSNEQSPTLPAKDNPNELSASGNAPSKEELDFDSLNMRLRLLKVYAKSNNQAAFDATLAKIPQEAKDETNPVWQEIVTLKNETWPEELSEVKSNETAEQKLEEPKEWGKLSFAETLEKTKENEPTTPAEYSVPEMPAKDKFKLAQTYFNMEDYAGAKELLEEILAEHNLEFHDQAQELLKKILEQE